jgi:hypothetical protein
MLTTGPCELDDGKHITYKIINKLTNVIEAEISVYSRAIALAVALDKTADEADELLKNKSMGIAGKLLFDIAETTQIIN